MELPESVELLRKTADRILRHYKQGKAIICDESAKNISEVEMDALEYQLGHFRTICI
jgi:acyl-CoA reductase-like NAD-dependent aldehyde dehydrogenase